MTQNSHMRPAAGSEDDGVAIHPLRPALIVSSLYLLFCAIYIPVSGHVAVAHARSVEELERIETAKGLIFVVTCAVLLFLLTWYLMKRIAREQQQMLAHRNALLAAERRATAGIFASSIAHDMNNILTVGVATADLLRSQKTLPPDQAALVRDLDSTFKRMTDLTTRLATTGHTGMAGEFVQADLVSVLLEEIAFARRHARLHACKITLVAPEAVPMRLCPQMLQQMLVNLLLNAADATGGAGRIEVRITRNENEAIIEVDDNGPGIPADVRARVFDAAYTTKQQGLGLGLLSVRGAVRMHHGRVEVTESPLGGARFHIALPVVKDADRVRTART